MDTRSNCCESSTHFYKGVLVCSECMQPCDTVNRLLPWEAAKVLTPCCESIIIEDYAHGTYSYHCYACNKPYDPFKNKLPASDPG